MTFRKAEYMIQKKHKFLIMLTAVVLLAVLLQMFHVQYRISKLSKTAYGISAVGTLSEPIEAIINGNSQYIELYSNCETLNKEIADTSAYCILYVREWCNSGIPYFTNASLQMPDDLPICEQASISISRSLLYLQEKALSFEHCKSLTYADKLWLNNALEQICVMEQLILDENIPTKIDGKADVDKFLIFLIENEDEFSQIHKNLVADDVEALTE